MGTRQRPVLNLHFHGVHVEHVDWPLPDNGFMGLFSCNVAVFRKGGDPGHRFIEAAVEVAQARTCSFRDGGIGRVGAMGLVLREGTAGIAVAGNHIQQTGAGGIGLGQGNTAAGYLKAAPRRNPGPATDGQWHHIAMVWNVTAAVVYRDGKPVINFLRQDPDISDLVDTYSLRIGRGREQSANSVLDEFAVFRRALTPEEIVQLAGRRAVRGEDREQHTSGHAGDRGLGSRRPRCEQQPDHARTGSSLGPGCTDPT